MRSPRCATRKLVEPIRAAIDGGKPFLGICLGLQLLFDKSYEDGEYEGLGHRAGRGRAVQRAGRVQSAAHGLEPDSRFAAGRRSSPASTTARTFISCTRTTSCRAMHRSIATETDYSAAVLLEHLARQSVRRAVPSGEEPGGRLAVAEEFRRVGVEQHSVRRSATHRQACTASRKSTCARRHRPIAAPCHSPRRVPYFVFPRSSHLRRSRRLSIGTIVHANLAGD